MKGHAQSQPPTHPPRLTRSGLEKVTRGAHHTAMRHRGVPTRFTQEPGQLYEQLALDPGGGRSCGIGNCPTSAKNSNRPPNQRGRFFYEDRAAAGGERATEQGRPAPWSDVPQRSHRPIGADGS